MKAELKRLLANLGELSALADQFGGLQSLAQAETESQARVAAAQREADELRTKLEADKAQALRELETIKAQADALRNTAIDECAALRDETKAIATSIVADAHTEADKVKAAANGHVEQAKAEAEDAERRLLDATAQLAEVEDRIAKARALVAPLAQEG